eukprot:gnl/Trimastix_PCT/2000.p1 GENE.gnl/Trimastix_PCT/2000~~gnl/Trimastix_PCT/2000.p1  ORF type:complete len:173 (-),score=25.52 gnl/Trimastix_PCT/2000:20-538(-)
MLQEPPVERPKRLPERVEVPSKKARESPDDPSEESGTPAYTGFQHNNLTVECVGASKTQLIRHNVFYYEYGTGSRTISGRFQWNKDSFAHKDRDVVEGHLSVKKGQFFQTYGNACAARTRPDKRAVEGGGLWTEWEKNIGGSKRRAYVTGVRQRVKEIQKSVNLRGMLDKYQ